MNKLSSAIQLGLLLLGVGIGAAFTPSCASDDQCNCPEPRRILTGEFEGLRSTTTGSASAAFADVKAVTLRIEADALIVKYEVDGQPGSASFSISEKYDLATP